MKLAVSLQSLEETGALTSTGLKLTDPNLPYERFEAVGALLGRAYRSLQWAIGDWLLLGEALYGDEVYQASEVLEMSPEGRSQYLRCALIFPPGRRRGELSWSHHRTLIALEPEDQDRWLQRAIDKGWSQHDLGAHLREELGPVNRGRGASTHTPNATFGSEHLVVDAVMESAREVIMLAAPVAVDGQLASYLVPADALRSLAHALGLSELADTPDTIGVREEAA